MGDWGTEVGRMLQVMSNLGMFEVALGKEKHYNLLVSQSLYDGSLILLKVTECLAAQSYISINSLIPCLCQFVSG